MLVSKGMKKYILYIILFFAIVTSIDFCYGKVSDYMYAHSKGGMSKQIYDLCMKNQYDVIIMGSSRAHYHYDPQIIGDSLGMSCYNAGYDGNGIILMYGFYKMITNRYTPKLIIYDVEQLFDIYEYENDNNSTRYLSGLKPFYNQPGVSQIFKVVSLEEFYKANSSLCRYNSNTIPLILDCLKARHMDNRGYSPLVGTFDYEPESKEGMSAMVLDSLKMYYMRNLFHDVSDKNIPMIVVASPRYGTSSSDVFLPIKSLCEEYNIPFVDFYSDSLFMSHREWFKEPVHLNEKGAHEYSILVSEEVKKYIDK